MQRLVNECKGERHDLIIINQKEALNELRLQLKRLSSENTHTNKNEIILEKKQENFINEKKLAEKRAKSALADIEHLTNNFNRQQENKNREEANLKTLSKNELKVKIFEYNKKKISLRELFFGASLVFLVRDSKFF